MFYEGTEKRLEIIVKHNNLRQCHEIFWQEMVAQAGASILSKIENRHICAYLLSESSLFIWKNKLLLITCGNTQLIKAALFFQKKYPKEQIQSLLFQRHQPLAPHSQKSSFNDDMQLLKQSLQGKTQHWSDQYKGNLFFSGKLKKEDDNSKQLLMLKGLSGPLAAKLQQGAVNSKQITPALAVLDFIPQLQIDQFTFSPKGYSLNAIAGKGYLTLHITPEKLSSYLSLESSFAAQTMRPLIEHLVQLFTPLQSHLMNFHRNSGNDLQISLQPVSSD